MHNNQKTLPLRMRDKSKIKLNKILKEILWKLLGLTITKI